MKILHTHPDVVDSKVVQKYVSVYDEEMSDVLQVFTEPDSILKVARDLERLPQSTVFHSDINAVQQFFINERIFPFGRVEFETDGESISWIKCLDDRETVEYETPDLDEVALEIFADTENIFPTMEDPIQQISVIHRGTQIRIDGLDEHEILVKFQDLINRIDPDVISTNGGDNHLFQYLTIRAQANGLQLYLSRDNSPLNVTEKEPNSFWQYNQIVFRSGNQVMFTGRLHFDRGESLYYSAKGLEGVIEGCRLAYSQPQRVSRMSIGSINAAVQYYTAYEMNILIPPIKKNPEFLKPVTDLAAIDRGGLIFQPRPDIYENVAECDFSSMYPTLMVTRNISPETICMKTDCPDEPDNCLEVPGLRFRICGRRRGIVSRALELVVSKRNSFKRLISEGKDADKYSLMENTLKGVLVSCFGYLGFKNARFGRVEAHTAVTALARDVLLKTRDIGEDLGFDLIHGIVDSVWLKSRVGRVDAERVNEFCRRVTECVGIPMSMKGVYRWMVIPSSRTHPMIAPLNRYYGVFQNGTIKTRGIETRRRDTCLYVGDCQMEMIKTLAGGRDKEGFLEKIPAAYEVCQDFTRRLHDGDVDLRDLVLHSRLTRAPNEYRAMSRASIVARQLTEAGKELNAGQKVRYIMIQADAESQMRRVRAVELLDETSTYDAEEYSRLCKRAFESLIPVQYLDYPSIEKDEKSWTFQTALS